MKIYGSDKAVDLYVKCLKSICEVGKEILSKKQKGETAVSIGTNINKNLSYKNFLNSWRKWNDIIREDLKIVKK